MSKPYLMAFNDALGTQDQVKTWLSNIPDVTHWRFDMPHAFYIVSKIDAKELSLKLRAQAGHQRGFFIISEITSDVWGYLTTESWYLIQRLQYQTK